MKKPINTSRDESHFEWLLGGNPRAIEAQEARGQSEFVQSDTLPTEMSTSDKAALEKCGTIFQGLVDGDNMFQYVTLPKGWSKKSTDRSMWSHLVDEKGRKRAQIFYKAVFYDRSAHLNLKQRYSLRFNYDRSDKTHEAVWQILDGETMIHETPAVSENKEKRWETQEETRRQAEAWLNEHFPGWQDCSAYWD